ncbi:MAG: corrinoid protein [Candidatus Bathyarchaeia archaeon]
MHSEILKELGMAVMNYDPLRAEELARRAMEEGLDPLECADVLIKAIREIGDKFEEGELFLTDLMAAAMVLEKAMPVLEEEVIKSGRRMRNLGKVVIGTVFGDIHSIGKTLVATSLTAAGFKVIDLGVNVRASEFVDAVRRYNPDILAMSALLTTTAPEQRRVIEALERENLRSKVKVIVGGGPITPEFAESIGADGYAATAPEAARLAEKLIGGNVNRG